MTAKCSLCGHDLTYWQCLSLVMPAGGVTPMWVTCGGCRGKLKATIESIVVFLAILAVCIGIAALVLQHWAPKASPPLVCTAIVVAIAAPYFVLWPIVLKVRRWNP